MTTAEILRRLPELSALVVGDICLDRWCTYDPSEAEPSRETGIPRVGVISTACTPGAGGTVANIDNRITVSAMTKNQTARVVLIERDASLRLGN